jgi:hypothetical protein
MEQYGHLKQSKKRHPEMLDWVETWVKKRKTASKPAPIQSTLNFTPATSQPPPKHKIDDDEFVT